jgi:hypothetical protein
MADGCVLVRAMMAPMHFSESAAVASCESTCFEKLLNSAALFFLFFVDFVNHALPFADVEKYASARLSFIAKYIAQVWPKFGFLPA